MTMQCPYGQIGQIVDYGVNDLNSGVESQKCVTDTSNAACTPTNP